MRIMKFGKIYAGDLREHSRGNAPSYSDSDREKPGNAGFKCGVRVHAAPLTNEFGQVQVKCSRKKPTWPLRSSEWNMGSRSACSSLSISLQPPPPPPPPRSYVSLATACDSPINERVPPHDPHRRALSTVMVFRTVVASPARCILAKCTGAAEMCCAKRWAGWKSARTHERSGYCREITTIRGEKVRRHSRRYKSRRICYYLRFIVRRKR